MKLRLILMIMVCVLAGCQEQQTSKVWGQGDPPEKWQEFFGNGNISRFNFVQTQKMNFTGQNLAKLTERVRKLEEKIDPND